MTYFEDNWTRKNYPSIYSELNTYEIRGWLKSQEQYNPSYVNHKGEEILDTTTNPPIHKGEVDRFLQVTFRQTIDSESGETSTYKVHHLINIHKMKHFGYDGFIEELMSLEMAKAIQEEHKIADREYLRNHELRDGKVRLKESRRQELMKEAEEKENVNELGIVDKRILDREEFTIEDIDNPSMAEWIDKTIPTTARMIIYILLIVLIFK